MKNILIMQQIYDQKKFDNIFLVKKARDFENYNILNNFIWI